MERILRIWDADTDLRDAEEGSDSAGTYLGHAAVYNQETLIGSRMFGFIERIAENAFDDVLNDDVRFLINHGGLPLARTTNATLRLAADSKGLFNEADIADTTEGRDLVKLVKRKDVNQQSFAFTIAREGAIWDQVEVEGDKIDRRTITRVGSLYDTSLVTYPAYTGATAIGMRSMTVAHNEIEEALREVRSMREVNDLRAADEAMTQERFLRHLARKYT